MKTKSFLTPIKLKDSFTPVIDIAAGQNISFLDQSSYIWSCGTGANSLNLLGANQSSPIANVANNTFVSLVKGTASCVAALDGSSYAWAFGNNNVGELGINLQGSSYGIPRSVVGNKPWLYLGSGGGSSNINPPQNFFCGLDFSSYAWSWGGNGYGQLGNNTTTNSSSPASIVGGRQFIKLSVGGLTTCALDSSSYAWGWGLITGDAGTTTSSSPVSVVGNNQFIDVQVGTYYPYPYVVRRDFVIAVDSSSYVWAWGDNVYGQYGNNTNTFSNSPIQVLSNEWNNIFVCGATIFAENKNNNQQYAWGENTWFQYGNNKPSSSFPTVITLPFKIKKICTTDPEQNSADVRTVIALSTSSMVWTWGANTLGTLGINSTINYSVPTKPIIATSYNTQDAPPFSKLSMCGNGDSWNYTMLYLDTSSNLWYWGAIEDYWFSWTDPQRVVFSPTSVPLIPGMKIMDFRLGYTIGSVNGPIAALDTSSYAWMWCSDNATGVMGNNIYAASRSYPVSVVGNKQWIKVVPTYYQTYGLDISSYIWAWGDNTTYGALGDNTIISKSSPVSVVGGRQALKMAVAHCYPATTSHSAGTCGFLDSSSYAWTFGCNYNGVLGTNSTSANRSSPISVVGGRQFINLGANSNTFFALDASSYLWSWGNNSNGQLGDGTGVTRSSPVSVIGGRQFTYIPDNGFTLYGMMLVLDASSYAWAWGVNTVGFIGNPSVGTGTSSPVSVLGGYQFADIVLTQNNVLGVRSYPNSEYIMWGLNQRYSNNFNLHASVYIVFSAPMLTRLNTYITSPVYVGKRKNILGK